jgi:hypothetical protein
MSGWYDQYISIVDTWVSSVNSSAISFSPHLLTKKKNNGTRWSSYKAIESSTWMHIIELQNQNLVFK